jgi:hypothetical protein
MEIGDGRVRLGEGLLALAFGVAVLAVLLPWPRPSLDLTACQLQPVGRFGYQCDLEALAERTGQAWLRQSLRTYEDGLRLRDAASMGDAMRMHTGSYYTDGRTLTFSALDGGDPRVNGRRYLLRSLNPRGPWRADRPWRQVGAGAALVAALGLLCFKRRERLRPLLWTTGVAVTVACAVVQVIAVLKESPVHVDAGYLLPAAESVARGAVPYQSLLYNYTPLGLLAFSLWGRPWPGSAAPHAWYLGLVLLSELVCAALVFLILRRAACAKDVAALTALCSFSMTLWFDGARILQEPLYLVPILAAAWLAWAPRVLASGLAAGALAALALLVKQYGGFGLWGLLASALVGPRDRLKRAAAIALGFLIAVSAVAVLMNALQVDFGGLARQAIGGNYPRRYESVWLKLFLLSCPIALLAVASPFLPGMWAREATRVAACFGLASLMPFYFRQHQYYFQNVIPWIFVLFALGADTLARRLSLRAQPLLHGAAVLLLLSMPVRAAADQGRLLTREIRSEQLRRARLMTNAWATGQPTLLLVYPGFYAITRYRSPDEGRLGYRFAHELTAEQLRFGFQRAAGVWVDRRGLYATGADRVLRSAGTSLDEQLSANGFAQKLVLEDRFELWTRGLSSGMTE